MAATKSIMICGPSQAGKSFLCQQFLSSEVVTPETAARSTSLAIGNGIDSCTKVLEIRVLNDLTIVDTVGFPDMDAKSVGLNMAVFNLALGLTIGKAAYEEAVAAYLSALANDNKASMAREYAAPLMHVGQQAEKLGIMGNIRCILFVIPCNNKKLFKTGALPMMEDFWSMCGGWRVLSNNSCGTLAVANNHGVSIDGSADWTVKWAKKFASSFWFSPGIEAWAYTEGPYDLWNQVHNWVMPQCERICESQKFSNVNRLLRLSEVPSISNLYGEKDADCMGEKVVSWCDQTMKYGRNNVQSFVPLV